MLVTDSNKVDAVIFSNIIYFYIFHIPCHLVLCRYGLPNLPLYNIYSLSGLQHFGTTLYFNANVTHTAIFEAHPLVTQWKIYQFLTRKALNYLCTVKLNLLKESNGTFSLLVTLEKNETDRFN